MGGLESILIRDNGTGISKARAEHDFESLGDSWKLQTSRTPVLSRAIHGKEGKGRLRFFSLAQRARWDSVYEHDGVVSRLTIEVDANRLQTCNVSEPVPAPQDTETGTIVELAPLKDTFDWLTSEEARADFNATFAPYVLQYPGAVIIYDNLPVNPSLTIDRAHTFETKPINCPGRVVRDMSLKVIEWKARVGSRKIYFGGETGVVFGSQAANITAPSLMVSRKELDQLEDYVNAILMQPDFINTSTFWNFYLVSSDYDDVVKERITQKERPVGLYLDKPNHKVWVKSWAELIRDCECRLEFVQEKLQIEVSAEEIVERISQLKSSILKVETEVQPQPPSSFSVDLTEQAPSPP